MLSRTPSEESGTSTVGNTDAADGAEILAAGSFAPAAADEGADSLTHGTAYTEDARTSPTDSPGSANGSAAIADL